LDPLTLEVVEGPDAGVTVGVPLAGELEIGRGAAGAEGAALHLNDEQASRRHARIVGQDRGLALLEDLGSRNGTLVNGRESHGPTILHPGDRIQIGTTVLQLRSATQLQAQPSAMTRVPPSLRVPVTTPDYIRDSVLHASNETPSLDALLDKRVRQQARTAPLALFVLVALAVLVYFATR
jgi:pSer/pThr/pTyr-binding forkhead associated (FHA) protein